MDTKSLIIKQDIAIPSHELEISASRSGGPGGQHVNKADTRITVRWNARNTAALTNEQKALVLQNLQAQLTTEGDLIIHSSVSRSQEQNRKKALEVLAQKIRAALYIPKTRMKTRIPKGAQEKRLHRKAQRSTIKKMRRSTFED